MDLPSPGEQVDRVAEALRGVVERMVQGGAHGLWKAGEIIVTDAKANYVPVDFGILRASGFVKEPVIDGDNAYVVIGFGGAASAYALANHEHLSMHSPFSWRRAEELGRAVQFHPSGQHGPKYLERPLLAHGADVKRCVAEETKKMMGFSG